jgi:hypothetical protein
MAQSQIFRGTARRIETNPHTGTRNYFYHSTPVVGVFQDGKIMLNSAGYRTNTTKLAMNQASSQDNLGFQVYARKREWLVSWKGQELPFEDTMILD